MYTQFKITEFLARNENSITDEDSEKSDWIEITNTTAEAFNIGGWHLTDNKSILNKWTFPSLDVPPQSRLIVFASGKNRSLGDTELHTNFMLDSNGEYLALVKPDGKTINSEYNYPKQKTDVSYGISFNPITDTIVSANTPIKWLVPASPIIGWGSLNFDSSEWNQGAFGVGYDTSEDYEPFFRLT